MIEASSAWKDCYSGTLVPESYVEISLTWIDTKAISTATYSGANASQGSNGAAVLGVSETTTPTNYASLEENLWLLDGTKTLRSSVFAKETGYVTEINGLNANIIFTLPEVTTVTIPGFLIVWSSEYEEYPKSFSITVSNSVTGASTTQTIRNNHSYVSVVDMEISEYDTVAIGLGTEWNTPNHRQRMDRFVFGHSWTFGKDDLISFEHEQIGDLLSGELPKNSITFSLDNTDDKWNPYNPEGIGKYLTERQQLIVRYGLDVNGVTEWIPGGTFYLSEWLTPTNGLEAMFIARDPFEFMLNVPYTGSTTGLLHEFISEALSLCDFPNELQTNLDTDSNRLYYTAKLSKDHNYSAAEVIQMATNASGCVCWFDREGVLQVQYRPWSKDTTPKYDISLDVAYSHPEVTLTKPLHYIRVSYYSTSTGEYEGYMQVLVNSSGEIQTVDNPMVGTAAQASHVASQVRNALEFHREVVSGEYRADPRLDVFDKVNVQSKYGDMTPVITRIKYSYGGSFHGEYEAKIVYN